MEKDVFFGGLVGLKDALPSKQKTDALFLVSKIAENCCTK